MALIYRAHFALIRSPIYNSKGLNTSAVFGFANALLDILKNQNPTHLVVAFDTPEPTERHIIFPEYKAQRDAMPEDIQLAIPLVKKLLEGFNVPIVECPGYEADDIVGTLVTLADKGEIECFMVTPDKDYAQLVADHISIYKPGRQNQPPEIMGVPEVLEKWKIKRVDQVIDILGLMGDASDNIPGIKGIGEKTAQKLIAEFGSIEALLENTDKLKGKQKEKVENGVAAAHLSKKLVTIIRDAPVNVTLDDFILQERNDEALQKLFVELEFNTLGKRLFGDSFQSGRGFTPPPSAPPPLQGDLFSADIISVNKSVNDASSIYEILDTPEKRKSFIKQIKQQGGFCFDTETTGLDAKTAELVGLSFSIKPNSGVYIPCPADQQQTQHILDEFRDCFEDPKLEKTGHHLKYDLTVLKWYGVDVKGPLFDTMIAHALIDPDQRHAMDMLAEQFLGHTTIPITSLIGEKKSEQISMRDVPLDQIAEYAAEDADITLRLREKLEPLLKEHELEQVFHEIECPLIPVLVDMEHEGIALDTSALASFSIQLGKEIEAFQTDIYELAGTEFNLNSPKQLGEVLFDQLKIVEKPKKTKTGQYATNEQVLTDLAAHHPIVAKILEYRGATKLKSTYVDALPQSLHPKTNHIHTNYTQVATATGRLASNDPNLQNIPIRTPQGREIRKAFIPRDDGHLLFAADYSQIELRIMAALSEDPGMCEAFEAGLDIHSATAAKVYGTELDAVTSDMRRTAKMVNFGIIYGISAFGLGQRLHIPRSEAAAIIEQYFIEYPKVKEFMDRTIEEAKEKGYVSTLTGRRRYLRDITSRNGTIRAAAERTAINSPIQGTAADLIKIAMINVAQLLKEHNFQTRMLLQVHDELVFDLKKDEADDVIPLVTNAMINALPIGLPIVVESGSGINWLEAH